MILPTRALADFCPGPPRTPLEFKLFLFNPPPPACPVRPENLVGRILKGRSEADFSTLTDDPDRRLVFLLGPTSLSRLVGLSLSQMLEVIGYSKAYVEQLRAGGVQFRLLVFIPVGDQVPATWANLLHAVATAYPSIANKVLASGAFLKSHAFAELDRSRPRTFAQIKASGPADPDYVDLPRLESRVGTPWEVRAFMFNVIHVNEFYSGDGFTQPEDHSPGVEEYLSPNRTIRDLDSPMVLSL